MEVVKRRLFPKIYKTLKDDDSSGDEKANEGGDKKVKNLQPLKRKSNWPPHLEKLYNELSALYPERDFKTPIKTAIKLLHALDVDEAVCGALRDEGVIVDMVNELQAKTMRFGEKLSGRDAFLLPIFKLLVKLDGNAAKQLHLLCDAKARDLFTRTEEYQHIATLSPVRPAFDRDQAKREMGLFIDRVKGTIKGDPKAYGTQLLLLVQGCPPSARGKVLKLLANDKVSTACNSNPELAAAVVGLQAMTPDEKGQVDTALALLVADINLAMAEAGMPGRGDFDFLQDPKVVALFAKVEESLAEQQFNLDALIATLCPGKLTTATQAKFVAGLMGHLIQSAHDRSELFDFQGFLSATLRSGMPGRCATWIANSAVRTCQTAYDVERLVEAMEQVSNMTGLEIGHWMSLGLLATVVGGDIGNPKYINPSIMAKLKEKESLDKLQQRLRDVDENSRDSISRLTAGFNPPGQMEKEIARNVELSKAQTERLKEEEKKKEQQRRQEVLKSVSVDVQSALDLMASIPGWDDKLQYAAAMSKKLQKNSFAIQQFVGELVAVGTDNAAEFLGVLTAMLLADGKPKLFDEMLIATLGKSRLPQKVAAGLVGTWYATQARAGRTTLAITTDLCAALSQLEDAQIDPRNRYDLYTQCKEAMRRYALGFKQGYEFTPADRQVLSSIKSLR